MVDGVPVVPVAGVRRLLCCPPGLLPLEEGLLVPGGQAVVGPFQDVEVFPEGQPGIVAEHRLEGGLLGCSVDRSVDGEHQGRQVELPVEGAVLGGRQDAADILSVLKKTFIPWEQMKAHF